MGGRSPAAAGVSIWRLAPRRTAATSTDSRHHGLDAVDQPARPGLADFEEAALEHRQLRLRRRIAQARAAL